MAHPFIGIHAAMGEMAIFAFLWVFVELLNPTEQRIKRAKIAAMLGVILIFVSWIAGGYYYVEFYSSAVKPIIKEGPMPYAHSVIMETKEHVFLFLPFLSILVLGLINKQKDNLIKNRKANIPILLLCGLIILLGLAMAGMGYLISTGARVALEAGIA